MKRFNRYFSSHFELINEWMRKNPSIYCAHLLFWRRQRSSCSTKIHSCAKRANNFHLFVLFSLFSFAHSLLITQICILVVNRVTSLLLYCTSVQMNESRDSGRKKEPKNFDWNQQSFSCSWDKYGQTFISTLIPTLELAMMNGVF